MSFQRFRRVLTALSLGSLLLASSSAHALTFVIDQSTGAVHEGIGDGWFFAGPGVPPPDGAGDADGQAPAVALQAGVVEMRAISEFPLAILAGYDAADIASATLTVTIDDVLSGFGPGTAFDGTASDPIAASSYPGDGTIATSDFAPAGMTAIGSITPGVVTDASLAVSGALSFDLDVTASLQAFLTAAETHYGVVLATLDSATGTSVDAVAPPGVTGGKLPYLTIVTVPATPPSYSKDALKCQAGIAKAASGLAAAEQKAFAKCLDTILKTVAASDPVSAAQSTCDKNLDETDAASTIVKARDKATAAILKACADLLPAAIDSPCDAGAIAFTATAACVVAATDAEVEEMIQTRYAEGCTLLDNVGFSEEFPGVCD